MSTSITAAIVRARWPHLASTSLVSDALMAILIAEADAGLNTSSGTAFAVQRETMVTHYAAHKATLVVAANQTNGSSVGPVVAESFLHRSESRASTSASEANPLGTILGSTAPGRELQSLLLATRRLPGLIS